LTRLK